MPRLGVVRFASRTITSFPIPASAVPRLATKVVFPTPHFPETIAIILVMAAPSINLAFRDLKGYFPLRATNRIKFPLTFHLYFGAVDKSSMKDDLNILTL